MAASPEKTLSSQIHLALGYFSQFFFFFFLLSVWQVGEPRVGQVSVGQISLHTEESNYDSTATISKNLYCVERRSIGAFNLP